MNMHDKSKFNRLITKLIPRNSFISNQSVSDNRLKSISESLINCLGGFPIAYLVGIIILPMSGMWIQHDPITANLAITSIFASISFVRTYYLRRLFARFGFDDNIVRLALKGIKGLTNVLRTSPLLRLTRQKLTIPRILGNVSKMGYLPR